MIGKPDRSEAGINRDRPTKRLPTGGAPLRIKLRREGIGTEVDAAPASLSIEEATITAPYGSHEYSETVAVVGASPSSKVIAGWGNHADGDENLPEADGLMVQATPSADAITFTVYGDQPFGGHLKLHYLLV